MIMAKDHRKQKKIWKLGISGSEDDTNSNFKLGIRSSLSNVSSSDPNQNIFQHCFWFYKRSTVLLFSNSFENHVNMITWSKIRIPQSFMSISYVFQILKVFQVFTTSVYTSVLLQLLSSKHQTCPEGIKLLLLKCKKVAPKNLPMELGGGDNCTTQ